MFGKALLGFFASVMGVIAIAGNSINCQKVSPAGVKQCELSANQSAAKPIYGIEPMPYALCSQARCQLSADKKSAKCGCDLIDARSGWESFSLSPVSYQEAKPTFDASNRLKSVQSNYSMANLSDFKQPLNQTCSYKKKAYWANCYGVRCSITEELTNGNRQFKASCICPVIQSKTFIIGVKGKVACRVSDSMIWSATQGGAMKAYGGNPMLILYQKLYPNSPPVHAATNHLKGNE